MDSSGNAYITGGTWSSDFPTQNPLQPDYGGSSDAFVAKLNASGSSLIYSTYLGGGNYDYGRGIAVDSSGNAYITGFTYSVDFPTQNPLQPDYSLSGEAFVVKITGGEICGCSFPQTGDCQLPPGTTIIGENVVTGIEEGNLYIPADSVLHLRKNATFIFNPGYSIICNGSITKDEGAAIKKGYLCVKYDDQNGCWSDSTFSDSPSCPEGRVRWKDVPPGTPPCSRPVANAGPDQTVTDADGNGQENVTLDGSQSEDPDGTIVSWVWTESASQIAIGETPTVTLSVGTHTITLTVTDDDNATDTDEVVITIQGVSPTPVITATKTGVDLNRGTLILGDHIEYTIVIKNLGGRNQPNNPGNEFEDVLSTGLGNLGYILGSASASSGTVEYKSSAHPFYRKIVWNGSIPAGSSVTIRFTSPINWGTEASNQGTVYYDSNGDGSNDSQVLTDDPSLPGNHDPTVLVVTDVKITVTKRFEDQSHETRFHEPGDTIYYTIAISNAPDGIDIPRSRLVDWISYDFCVADVFCYSTSGDVHFNEGTRELQWDGALPAGEVVGILFDVVVDDVDPGTTVRNQAHLFYSTQDNGMEEDGWEGEILSDDPDTWQKNDSTDFVVDVPAWRRTIQPGDILYDPCTLLIPYVPDWIPGIWKCDNYLGHVGIYIGKGLTADPQTDKCRHHISSWDADTSAPTAEGKRNKVLILRVNCGALPREAAAEWAKDVSDPARNYTYQLWPEENLKKYGWCKNPDKEAAVWYCSELVWAAYFNLNPRIDIEAFPGNIETGWFYNPGSPVSPNEICEDKDTYTLIGHTYGNTSYPEGIPVVIQTGKCDCDDFLYIILDCPVDLIVIDPDGLVLSKDQSEIPSALYWMDDFDADGSLDVLVALKPKKGNYQIYIEPRPEADPTDTYTLIIKDGRTGQEVE